MLPTCERKRNSAMKSLKGVKEFITTLSLETGKLEHIQNRF